MKLSIWLASSLVDFYGAHLRSNACSRVLCFATGLGGPTSQRPERRSLTD